MRFATHVAGAALAGVVAMAAALFPGSALALIPPDLTFTIGDKLFDQFTCSGVPCAGVTVDPIPGGGFGARFNPGLTLTGTGELDVLLGFHVSVIGGAPLITDFHLSSNAVADGSGSVVDVLEICTTATCTPGSAVVVAPTLLQVPPPGGIALDIPSLAGGPYSELWIFDDVAVSGRRSAGHRFDQSPR